MGDISVVRGGHDGTVRAVKMLAGGAIEEGDLVAFGSTDGEIVKVATNGIDPIGVAQEDIADTKYGMVNLVGPGAIIEGTGAAAMLQGDEVGLVVDGVTGAITFDEDGSNIAGYVYKVVDATNYKIQVRLIPTGQKI